MSKTYTSEVVEILENGDAILQLPDDLLADMGWKEGDTLNVECVDGVIVLQKVEKKEE